MPLFISEVKTDLATPLKTTHLSNELFTQDNRANEIRVRVYKNDEFVPLTGSITCYVRRADDSTVVLNGRIEDGIAAVTMTETVYTVPGPIRFIIRNVSGSEKTVIAACEAYMRSSTSVDFIDPGEPYTDILNLIAKNLKWENIEGLSALISQISKDELTTGNILNSDINWTSILNAASINWTSFDGLQANILNKILSSDIDLDQISGFSTEVAKIADAQIGTAKITSAQIEDLTANVANIADARIANATITQAQIEDLSATIASIVNARIAFATIDVAQINNLSANIADIVDAHIENAEISVAQIKDLDADLAKIVEARIKDATIDVAKIDFAKINDAEIEDANILVLTNAISRISQTEIGEAHISYANIYDLTADKAIITQGSGEKLFISRLAVNSAQMVDLTVGQFTVKAKDGKYYRLDVDIDTGNVKATEVTVTSQEINAGKTSSGQHIIESDLTVGELNTSSAIATEALINKLTAGRIDVDTLFARDAVLHKIEAMDITGNEYLRLMVNNRSKNFTQWSDPASTAANNVQDGDIWVKDHGLRTWSDASGSTWTALSSYTWASFLGPRSYVRKNNAWVDVWDLSVQVQHEAKIDMTSQQITIQASTIAENSSKIGRLTTSSEMIEARVSRAETTVEGHTTQIASLQVSSDEIVARVSSTEKTVNGHTTSIAKLQEDAESITASVSKTEKTLIDGVPKVKTSTSKIVIEADKIELSSGGIFKVDGDNFSIAANGDVTMTGKITAESGKIGGWTINKYALYSGSSNDTRVGISSNAEGSDDYAIWVGHFTHASAPFSVKRNGEIKASSGTVGGWKLGTDKLSSGSGTSYVHMSTSGDYAFLAGNSTESSAPFRVTRDGTVYLTRLISLGLDSSGNVVETPINLRNYPLWKLSYNTIKAHDASSITLSNGDKINFKSAASASIAGSWSGNKFTVNVTDTSGNIILSRSEQLTPSHGFGATIDTFDSNHRAIITVVAASITGSPLFIWYIDASGEYTNGVTAGKNGVTLTSAWSNGEYTVTASNGATRRTGALYILGNGTPTALSTARMLRVPVKLEDEDGYTRITDALAVDASAMYEKAWAAARAKVATPSAGTDSSFTVKVPSATVDAQQTLTFSLTKGATPSNSGYAAVSQSGTVVGRIAIGDWYTAGYAAGWEAAKATIARDGNKIVGPGNTVDTTADLFTVTAGVSMSSISNTAPNTFYAYSYGYAYIDGVSVANKYTSKSATINVGQ